MSTEATGPGRPQLPGGPGSLGKPQSPAGPGLLDRARRRARGWQAEQLRPPGRPRQTLDSADEIFAWQHDPEAVGQHTYTWFDNESAGTSLLPASRAITVRLNPRTRVATLVAADSQPEGLAAPSQGNAQTTGNGDLFVGWGALPYFSEFSPSGELLFNAAFPAGVNTYRAYRLPWPGR